MIFIYIFGVILAIFCLTVFFGPPYVPSHKKDLRRLFAEINLDKNDTLADIGSGDGVVLKIASEFGARGIGFEINPILVVISRWRLRKNHQAQIFLQNFWQAFPIQPITIFYTFGHEQRIRKMYNLAQIQATHQKSALKFISYGFEIPNLKPSQKIGAHFIYIISPKNIHKSPKL